VDLVAVITARMKGWQTRSFPEKFCLHHRKMGTGMHRGIIANFKHGRGDYMLGGHPVWEFFRCIYQMKNRPFIVGGILRLLGFYWALLTRVEKCVSPELVEFRRKEQMCRLWKFFKEKLVPTRARTGAVCESR
jgi:hypothetical protein